MDKMISVSEINKGPAQLETDHIPLALIKVPNLAAAPKQVILLSINLTLNSIGQSAKSKLRNRSPSPS